MLASVKNILYASDLGEGSRPAFRHAVKMANLYGAKLTFLHTLEQVSDGAKGVLQNVIDRETLEQMEREGAERMINKIKERIEKFVFDEIDDPSQRPPSVEAVVEQGTPWRTITDIADKMNADMIVMGVRTHSTLQHMLLGSTSQKVISHSMIPVLVVPLPPR